MPSITYDARGHGRSEGAFGPSAIEDALKMCELMRTHTPRVGLRGSSLGGMCAILAAAASGGRVGAVAAICPAPPELLLRGLHAGTLEGFRADVEALEPWLAAVSLDDAAASLSPHTALLLMHARGDEQVPYTVSER